MKPHIRRRHREIHASIAGNCPMMTGEVVEIRGQGIVDGHYVEFVLPPGMARIIRKGQISNYSIEGEEP